MKQRESIDIEKLLIWTYQVKAADKVMAGSMAGAYGPGPLATNAQNLMRVAALGCRIDSPGAGTPRHKANDLDPDAEAVHDAVLNGLSIVDGAAVLYCAYTGSRPDWMPGAVSRMVPVLRGNGKPRMRYHDRACTRPSHCLLKAEPEQSTIDDARRRYVEWWDALHGLANHLDSLSAFIATGPSCKREPWLDQALTTQIKLDYLSAR